MIASATPKLDAALIQLKARLERLDRELLASATPTMPISSALRASQLQRRIRNTIKELETYTCN